MRRAPDLARIRELEEKLLGAARRTDPERTRRFFAGDLPGYSKEENTMDVGQEQIAIRLPKSLLARADGLVQAMADDPKLQALAGRVTRSTVIRLAVAHGLAVLEAEYAHSKRGGRKAR